MGGERKVEWKFSFLTIFIVYFIKIYDRLLRVSLPCLTLNDRKARDAAMKSRSATLTVVSQHVHRTPSISHLDRKAKSLSFVF